MAAARDPAYSAGSAPPPVEVVRPSRWWALALLGLIQIVAGVFALAYPDLTLLALGLVFGINLALAGTILIVVSAAEDGSPSGIKAVSIVVGVLTVVAGLLCLVRPGASILVLLLCMSFWFLLTGITALVEAIHVPAHRGLNAFLGVLGITAGIIVVGDPDIGLNTLADLAGILLVIRGVLELAAGLYLRRAT
jgi:uncharacterized membrane protein HdeD (DUF308 family)